MKNILVTGVNKGLGLSITKTLLNNKFTVYGTYRSLSNELELLKEEYKNDLQLFRFDLAESDKVKKILFGEFMGLKTPIHGFVNNAAVAYDDIVTNINLIDLENMFKINVYTPMILTKYAIRNMLLHKLRGSIVHISSISAHAGYKGLSMYASTKGALEAFSKNSAREWGERGIRSNCVVAGFMETKMSSGLSSEQKDKIYKRTSLKKATNIESVANTVEFLLSDKSHSITGQNIFVDSGTI